MDKVQYEKSAFSKKNNNNNDLTILSIVLKYSQIEKIKINNNNKATI